MTGFVNLRERMKALGHETHPLLIFQKLDEAGKGAVTLNDSDMADLEEIISSLVIDLENRKS